MKIFASQIGSKSKSKANAQKQTLRFSGSLAAQRELTEQIMKNSPSPLRLAMKLGLNDGEALNTLVTGIGTAFVAPIFIVFNPFTKEDKETRKYSAWRQPISAVLAVAAQLFINNKFNHMMDWLASTGQLKDIGVDFRTKGHIRKDILHNYPRFLDDTSKVDTSKSGFFRRLFKLDEREYRNNMINAEILNEQSKNIRKRVEEARKKLTEKDYDFDKLISIDDKNKAEEYVKKTYKNQLVNMSSSEKKAFLKDNINKKAAQICEERIRDNAKAKWQLKEYAGKYSTVQDALDDARGQLFQIKNDARKEALWKDIIRRLEMTQSYEAAQNKPAFSTISNLGKTYDDFLKNVKIKQFVLKNIEDSASLLKKYKKWGGLVVLIATLPVSCGLLNWSYPRIMEKIMPEASKKKKAKEQAANMEAKKCQ